MKRETLKGYGFILPWLLGFFLLTAGPMVYSFYLSFTASNLLSPPQWIGLENYQRMFFEDPLFYRSLLRHHTMDIYHALNHHSVINHHITNTSHPWQLYPIRYKHQTPHPHSVLKHNNMEAFH